MLARGHSSATLTGVSRSTLHVAAAMLTGLAACTNPNVDGGPSNLERHFEDSGENFALSFDGIDDYVTCATAQFPDGRHEQTVSTWFTVDTLVDRAALLTLRKD